MFQVSVCGQESPGLDPPLRQVSLETRQRPPVSSLQLPHHLVRPVEQPRRDVTLQERNVETSESQPLAALRIKF